jgi:SAM-dependent methyltransferase
MKQFWEERAAEHGHDQPTISQVLDPADKIGFKNRYLDAFSKYYVRKYLKRTGAKRLLEVGSGVGRLTEYLADDFEEVIGCDLTDTYVAQCNALPNKKRNTIYLSALDHEGIRSHRPELALMCWVIQYIEEDADLTALFQTLRDDGVRRFVMLEHARTKDFTEEFRGAFYTKVRSIATYRECVTRAGFVVDSVFPLGEVNGGRLYRSSATICRTVPRLAARLAPLCFTIDRMLLDTVGPDRQSLLSDRLNTDVLITGGIS